jgi:mono/diheme cytochrome c family protein
MRFLVSSFVVICVLAGPGLLVAEPGVAGRWEFGTEETSSIVAQGEIERDIPGPRPPDYPDFEPNNTAIQFGGSGARLVVEDTGANSAFDFANGDAVTIEAWVRVTEIRAGENAYIIGKGRTGAASFPADNQNWALRVREIKGRVGISFLFATPTAGRTGATDAHWHRWTTIEGFSPGKTWHHVAVTYRFGEPESMRGWIDGRPREGVWDMGGPTKEPPVVDNDAVWIGSSRGGAAANSFRGGLDSLVVHRLSLNDETIKARYRFTGTEEVTKPAAEVMPDLGELTAGQTLITLHEGFPAHDRWLNEGETLSPERLRWVSDHCLLDRLPQRFDAWGIRDAWKGPVLLRLATEVTLPPGEQRFLMRVRGLSRLWVNGEVIARSRPVPGSPSGEEPITPVVEPPHTGLRRAEHRQQEITGVATIGPNGTCRLVLETLVGGKAFRTDPGETLVAIESADQSTYHLLPQAPGSEPLALTDRDVETALARQSLLLEQLDDRTRRTAAATRDDYWRRRREQARTWAEQHPAPQPPVVTTGTDKDETSASHPIDAFLAAKVAQAVTAASATPPEAARQFHSEVLPILRDQCQRCHGDKEQGGLRLNSREAALKAGDSELPAVVPGQVDESELILRIRSTDPAERMPPGASPLSDREIALLEAWVKSGVDWPAPPIPPEAIAVSPLLADEPFLRRLWYDTRGVPPPEVEIRAFVADAQPDKRSRMIDRLLSDDHGAEDRAHHWMGYWQDVLAENPTLLNASLNTTGPFRWFLYDALRDGKSLDRIVTELILLRGSPHEGGSAGFGIAADNDAPFAAKGQIVASAFLGIELQCARCHDSPYHSTLQRDLYSLAAMFERKAVTVPKTSRVPAEFFEKQSRQSLIKVTLRPDEPVEPVWPFPDLTPAVDAELLASRLEQPDDSRERLAALITAPENTRFARVMVNRVWRRLMGAGLVEPVHDWEGRTASHPELLDWLAHEFTRSGYDLKHVTRLILTSQLYQRAATGQNLSAGPELRFFTAPDRRRLSAEQLVDTFVVTSGRPLDVEEFTFDPDARRPSSNRLTLGVPRRAWMLADLANERDRPSLSLPKARAIADLMEAFGWSGARQSPRTDRETAPNVLQPGVLANSVATLLWTRVARESGLAELAITAESPIQLVDSLFLRYLGRLPEPAEREPLVAALAVGFGERVLSGSGATTATELPVLPKVTWSNHLMPDASTIALEMERRARLGPSPDPRLEPAWRELLEDVIWSLVNMREFVWLP